MNSRSRLGHTGCVVLVAAIGWFALTGCKPSAPPGADHASNSPTERVSPSGDKSIRQPTVGDLTAFLRAEAPAWERIVDVRMDPPAPMPNASPVGNAWLLSVKFTIVPTADLLSPATAQNARSFQTTMNELDLMSRWSEAYARSSYGKVYPAVNVQVPSPTSPQLLSVVQPKDRPLAPTYGKLAAEWQVDHWQFGNVDVNLPETGQPRGQFSDFTLVLGSPEAERLVAAANTAITQVKAQKAAIEQSYRADLLKTTGPGALYRGQIRHRSTVAAAEVRFAAPPAGADPQQEVQLEVSLPATPGEAFTYIARRAKQLPLQLAASTRSDEVLPTEMLKEAEPLPRGDLTLSFVAATGKEGVYDETVPVALLNVTRHYTQPSSLTLHVQDGHLEGRLNGFDATGFVLTAQQNP